MNAISTPLLDRVRYPADLRNFSAEQLRLLADELRAETVDAVSVTGGHLGASLGVVELTGRDPRDLRYAARPAAVGCRASGLSA